MILLSNINYYMNDTNGIPQRDSLYYYICQLPSGSSELPTARLLLQDGYADSAYTIFHGSNHFGYRVIRNTGKRILHIARLSEMPNHVYHTFAEISE